MSNRDAFLVRLREWVGECQTRGIARLPSLRHIAIQFYCSKQTATEALRNLEKEGLLRRIEPSGRYVTSALQAMQSATSNLTTRSREVLEALTKDLDQKGDNPGQCVGSAREFQRRFHASHATVAAALNELLRLGRLTRKAGTYCLPPSYTISSPRASNSRLVIAGHPQFKRLLERQLAGFFDRLRDRLLSAGWAEPLELFGEDPVLIEWPPQHQIAGIIFVPAGGSAQWQKYLGNLRKVPQAIIDYYLGGSPHFYRHVREAYHVILGNRAAGTILGRHLKECGAQRMAFFTQQALSTAWVSQRIEGLSTWYPQVAGDPKMSIFGPDEAVGSRVPGGISKTILGHTAKMHFLAGKVDGISPDAIRAKLKGAYSLADLVETAALMGNQFKNALSRTEIDAWVCENDDLASIAQSFLQNNSAHRRILLAGFDNSVLSRQERITSVDLRGDFLADMALDAIFHRIPSRKSTERSLYPEPKIWIRQSTRLS